MEASSHGLDQRRLDGVRLKAAAFTNFTQDHLDYHKTFEAYFEAKARLFDRVLPEDGVAVVNMNDPRGQEMTDSALARGQRLLTRGPRGGGRPAHPATAVRRDRAGGALLWQGQPHQVRLNLIGGFQAENVALAAGLAIATGDERRRSSARCPG